MGPERFDLGPERGLSSLGVEDGRTEGRIYFGDLAIYNLIWLSLSHASVFICRINTRKRESERGRERERERER